jgi:hypothetical protein
MRTHRCKRIACSALVHSRKRSNPHARNFRPAQANRLRSHSSVDAVTRTRVATPLERRTRRIPARETKSPTRLSSPTARDRPRIANASRPLVRTTLSPSSSQFKRALAQAARGTQQRAARIRSNSRFGSPLPEGDAANHIPQPPPDARPTQKTGTPGAVNLGSGQGNGRTNSPHILNQPPESSHLPTPAIRSECRFQSTPERKTQPNLSPRQKLRLPTLGFPCMPLFRRHVSPG